MQIIGITGGIASGKSLVLKILSKFRFKVYNTDVRAKYLMNNNIEIIKLIKFFFGKESYIDNQLNTRFLSKKIFSNYNNMFIINNIIQSRVEKDFFFIYFI